MARKNFDPVATVVSLICALAILLFISLNEKGGQGTAVFCALLIPILTFGLWFYVVTQNRKFRAIRIANIDCMGGVEFELYLRKLLSSRGYNVGTTKASGDLGVDLIASRNQEKIAIQVKRCNNKISRRAVSDAVAGKQHYRCNKAMVITNNYFTPGAVLLASSTECILVDRDALARWILQLMENERQPQTRKRFVGPWTNW